MSKEHFEPVTARSLAIAVRAKVMNRRETATEYMLLNELQEILEPHIRKPSDGMMADSAWVTGGMKSVPARCEEAYDEAISLLCKARNAMSNEKGMSDIRATESRRIYDFLQKPSPFKEAEIIKSEVDNLVSLMKEESDRVQAVGAEPQLLPFDLKAAQEGAKVVTRDGRSARVVADDLDGDYKIGAVVPDSNGLKTVHSFTLEGKIRVGNHNDSLDLFILKEPDTIELNIYRYKASGDLYAWVNAEAESSEYELIKTITVTI